MKTEHFLKNTVSFQRLFTLFSVSITRTSSMTSIAREALMVSLGQKSYKPVNKTRRPLGVPSYL